MEGVLLTMASYLQILTSYYGDAVADTLPSATGKKGWTRYDTDGSIFISDGTNWDSVGGAVGGGDVYLANANVFTAVQKINVDNSQQMTFYRPVNTGGFGAGFYYNFNNSTPAEVTYGNEYVSIESNTAGSHRGDFNVQLAVAASLGMRFRVFTSGDGGIIFGNNQRILISETGLTSQKTYTFPDITTLLAGVAANNVFTGVNSFDLRTQLKALASTPSDPAATYAEIYGKVKDASNDGIFAKVKIDGVFTEYELGVADDVLTLNELADVTNTTPAVNQSLVYQTGSATFENKILKTRHAISTGFTGIANGARHLSLFGVNIGSLATETNIDHELGMAMTVKRVRIKISTNGRDSGNQVFTLRKNQADFGGVSHTVAFTATTAYDSGEITASYAAGDDIGFKVDNGGTTGTLTAVINVEYEVSAFV